MLISALSLQATDLRSPNLHRGCTWQVQQLPGIWPTFRGHRSKWTKTFWDNAGWHKS